MTFLPMICASVISQKVSLSCDRLVLQKMDEKISFLEVSADLEAIIPQNHRGFQAFRNLDKWNPLIKREWRNNSYYEKQ